MRVLYLEDDEKLSNIVRTFLQDKLIIDIASNYNEAKRHLLAYHYDIALLDRNINGQDVGMNLIDLIHRRTPDTGIIVLSAYSTIDDKISGLELGANDYMEKPYSLKELYARIQALQRRNLPNIINIKSIKFDTSSKRIFDNNSEIFLSNKENNLLFYLLINRNKLISREQLLHSLYLHPEEISSNAMNVRINAIRKKLPIDIIKNIPTRGYIIEVK
jgi:two-component system OmpR family response regulator